MRIICAFRRVRLFATPQENEFRNDEEERESLTHITRGVEKRSCLLTAFPVHLPGKCLYLRWRTKKMRPPES